MRVLLRAATAAVVLTGVTGSALAADQRGGTPARGPVRHAPTAAYHPVRTSADAQPHEARIAFPGGGYYGWWTYFAIGPVYFSEPDSEDADGIVIDPGDYPAGAVFFVRETVRYNAEGAAGCSRLYDASTQQVVAGSEVCGSQRQLPGHGYRIQDTAPVALTAGEHVYDLQGLVTSDPLETDVHLLGAQLIVRWTE